MSLRIYQVDAFADEPFTGNPAGVCLLERPAPEDWMHKVAMEMNLSETAFFHPAGEENYNLRWFTPTAEVDLCGHATLASAHILYEQGIVPPEKQICFNTKSGPLTVKGAGDWLEMDFPAAPVSPVEPPAGMLEAVGSRPLFVGRSRSDYLLELVSEGVVRSLKPDLYTLIRLPVRGIIVTAKSTNPQYDFVSRFFAPAVGVPEDPVTGSAHCSLGPYWKDRLGKSEFLAYQASRRGGEMRVRVVDDRVLLSGKAITMMRCDFILRHLQGNGQAV